MRKIGLIAALLGFAMLAFDVALRLFGDGGTWFWLPGLILTIVGASLLLWAKFQAPALVAGAVAAAGPAAGVETAKLLDNFEQRFAELKTRKTDSAAEAELYALGAELEVRARWPEATAVYRHLMRIDPGYRDVGLRLGGLLDRQARPGMAPGAVAPGTATTPDAAQAARSTVRAADPRTGTGEAKDVAADHRGPSDRGAAERPPVTPGDAVALGAERAEAPGVRQLGRYRLEREIGRGAMGIVYLGRDMAINRAVAIKAIPLAREFDDAELHDARVRFFREAETAGRLNHPNIVTIYDVGEEGGLAYIAMEYLRGHHLSEYAASSRLLEPRKVLELGTRTADALGFAHKQHVVHRDIKPANLMYDPATDILKITDFGIARITGAGSTRTGIVLGTPSFMSPEQLEGRTVTGHSDMFSLGVSLFQLLTGQLPFAADSMTGLMQQIAEAPHPPLRAFRPDLPACVETVIDRALAKNPAARFDTGAQMAAALEDCRIRIPSGMP
jgi:serine/threonine-protein kinase